MEIVLNSKSIIGNEDACKAREIDQDAYDQNDEDMGPHLYPRF